MKILVAIANYGESNRRYLLQLLKTYRKMPVNVQIVILSDRPKDFGHDVEVIIGLPSSNPWSLPFSHRKLFGERVQDYDWFIYSEDDTLLEWKTLDACIEANRHLGDNEIPGFLRFEVGQDGRRYISTCHTHFRWLPSSVRQRNGQLWAHYTNEHSACYVASRQQLQKAIDSGGFIIAPYEGRYDMLCSAATDIYTRCGMEKLICLDRIFDFSLHHLPNKYIGLMGLPEEELQWQIEALRKVWTGELPKDEMFEPETKLPGGYASKRLHDRADPFLKQIVTEAKGLVLVWGAGDGRLEEDLQGCDRRVAVIAFNWILAECCRRRGLEVLGAGRATCRSPATKASVVVLADVLHLVEEPLNLLMEVRDWIKPKGLLLLRIPNLRDIRMLKRRWEKPGFRLPLTRERLGCSAFTADELVRLLYEAGFKSIQIKAPVTGRFEVLNRFSLGLFASKFAPFLYVSAKKD